MNLLDEAFHMAMRKLIGPLTTVYSTRTCKANLSFQRQQTK